MTLDWAIYLPWPNPRQPFVSLHWTRHGYEIVGGKSYPCYFVQVGCGRTFMPSNDSGHSRSWWFARPWPERSTPDATDSVGNQGEPAGRHFEEGL